MRARGKKKGMQWVHVSISIFVRFVGKNASEIMKFRACDTYSLHAKDTHIYDTHYMQKNWYILNIPQYTSIYEGILH